MSRLLDTQRAYDHLAQLLNEEIRKRRGSANELERFRETLDVAFYLLGWAQFEYLVRKETEDRIDENEKKARTVERHAWKYLKANVKNLKVRLRLDLLFHAQPTVQATLKKDYDVRNDAAHNYKTLPPEAKRISAWLRSLEDLVDRF
jgi:GAF domain-containing protein